MGIAVGVAVGMAVGVAVGKAVASVLGGVGRGARGGRGAREGRVVEGGAVEVETEVLLLVISLETRGREESLPLEESLGEGTWRVGGEGRGADNVLGRTLYT